MINIKTNFDGEGTNVECEVHIEGRKAAVREFYGVIKTLSKADNEVFTDALGLLVDDKFKEMRERSKDDESDG